MRSVVAKVSAALEVADGEVRELRAGELGLDASADAMPALADRAVRGLEGRLVSLFASDERDTRGCFLLYHVCSLPALHSFLHIGAPVDPA